MSFGGFNFGGGGGGTSTFGSTGFGSSSGFGSTQSNLNQSQSSGLFGSTNTFGGFGGSTATATTGTTVKFTPVNGSDTVQKNGIATSIQTQHQCITAMKEYDSKSFEELRWEDYQAKRKHPQQQPSVGFGASTGLFGASTTAQPSTGTGLFGSTSTGATTGGGGGLFGAKPTTSLFGSTPAASTPSTGIFGSTTTGTTANKSLFGTTGTTSGFGGFGSTTATASPSTGLFGSTAPKPSLFGTPTTTQPSSGLFGSTQSTTPSTGLFGASTGGFGSTATGTPTTGTTGGGIFGSTTQPAAQTTGGFGGFGSTTTSTASPFSFGGATTTTSAPSTGGIFSLSQSTAAKPTGFGSPFGSTTTTPFASTAPTTTTPSTGGIFGATAAKPAFGTTTGTTTGGFGGFGSPATSTASPFSFGASTTTTQPTATTSTASPFGGFGATTASTAAAKPFSTGFSGFGTGTTGTTTGFGTGTLGSTTGTTSGGLFGASSTGLGTGTALGGTSTGFGGFGASPATQTTLGTGLGGIGGGPATPQQQQQAYVPQQVLALVNSPYGSSPLFRQIMPDKTKEEMMLKPVNPVAQKSFMADTTNILKGGLTQSVKLTPKAISKQVPKSAGLFEGLEEDEVEVPSFVPRKNIKKLLFKPEHSRRSSTSNSIASEKVDFLSEPANQPPHRSDSFTATNSPFDEKFKNYLSAKSNKDKDAYMDNTMNFYVNRDGNSHMTNDYTNVSDDGAGENHHHHQQQQVGANEHPAKIVLQRPEYFVIPTLEELETMVDKDGNCYVQDFSIGRIDYGCVTFPGVTNVAGMNLDDIVHIRRKTVDIYPDESKKPSVGLGLNKPAEVTLFGVWPSDKETKLPITDPTKICAMGFNQKLEKATIAMGAEFVDYDIATGSWIFRVEHFSKYGLDDSDDEDNTNAKKNDPKEMINKQLRLIELRRQELAKQKNMASASASAAPKIGFNNLNLEFSEDESERASMNSNKENNNGIYPDLSSLKKMNKTRKLYPSLPVDVNDLDQEVVTKRKFINNLDVDNKAEFLMMDESEKAAYEHEGMFTEPAEFNMGFDRKIGDNFENGERGKKLLNAFFGDDDMDIEERSSFKPKSLLNPNLVSHETHFGKASPAYGSIGLDGNLKNELLSFGESASMIGGSKLIDDSRSTITEISQKPKFLNKHLSNYYKAKEEGDNVEFNLPKYMKMNRMLKSGIEPMQIKKLSLHVAKVNKEYVALEKSLFYKRYVMIADSTLFNSKRFRPCWYHPTSYTSLYVVNDKIHTFSSNVLVQQKQMQMNVLCQVASADASLNERLVQNCESYLKIQYDNSTIEISEKNRIPRVKPNNGNKIINEFYKYSQEARNKIGSHPDADNIDHINSVWSLCECLWGNLEELDLMNLSEKSISAYELAQLRKKALTSWLSHVSSQRIEREIKLYRYNKNSESYLGAIYSLLTGNRLLDACAQAMENNDYRLALLLSQCGTNKLVRDMMSKQLNEWNASNAQKFINMERLKLYVILSGEITFKFLSNNLLINTCDNLDWKRQFAMHLWYNCFATSSIDDAMKVYETSVVSEVCKKPYPPYLEDKLETPEIGHKANSANNSEIFDTCYHLIKLFCDKTHPIADIVAPECHTSNKIDFRLSWHLAMALIALEYHHISTSSLDNLHDSFATQLQTLDLWHWSIFILLHIEDERIREKYVKHYLSKNVTSSKEFSEKEKFVHEKLHVPPEWIFEAKAMRAKYDKLLVNEIELLIKAQKWNQAHLILVDAIGPDCIIKDNYQALFNYLTPLSREIEHIHKWNTGGKIYYDFIRLDERFKTLIREKSISEEDFRILHDQITYLAGIIKDFDCQTPKKRQCCMIISKLLLKLFHIFIELSNSPEKLLTEELVDKALQKSEATAEHDLINEMRILQAKYMFNALKLRKPTGSSLHNTNLLVPPIN